MAVLSLHENFYTSTTAGHRQGSEAARTLSASWYGDDSSVADWAFINSAHGSRNDSIQPGE